MTDIFLSYSSADRAAAKRLQDVLEAHGLNVFWDQETPPGVDWDAWIREKLDAAKLVVVLWSRTSVASPNVRHEAIIARDADKLLPVLIDRLSARDIPMGLYFVQAIDLSDWRRPESLGIVALREQIDERLGHTGPRRWSSPVRRGPVWPLVFAVLATLGLVSMWSMRDIGARNETAPVELVLAPPPAQPARPEHEPAPVTAESVVAASPPEARRRASFAERIEGRWRTADHEDCTDGLTINLSPDRKRLVFSSGETRYVHVIERLDERRLSSRVLEPEFALGEQYLLRPAARAGGATGFDLILENATAGTREKWTSCHAD